MSEARKGSRSFCTADDPKNACFPVSLGLTSASVDGLETSQRKEPDEILAFLRRKALDGEQDFVDGLADGHQIADQKHAGHRLSGTHALVGEIRHGVAIMGERDGTFGCRPGENVWVGSRAQRGVKGDSVNFGSDEAEFTLSL
jgi:hypothetical protein